MRATTKILATVLLVATVAGAAHVARGEDGPQLNWLTVLAQADKPAPAPPKAAPPPKPAPREDEGGAGFKPIPMEFRLKYDLVTDYVWRGMNRTEHPGEGRERVSHQFTVGAEADMASLAGQDIGSFGAEIWFSWWSGQQAATNHGACDDLQEVDYKLYWRKDLRSVGTEVELGWICYTFPRYSSYPGRSSDQESSYEIFAKLTFDDSALFGVEEPVLNPYVYWGLDLDLADEGSWFEVGVEHKFGMAGQEAVMDYPGLRYLSFTPSLSLGIDNRYLQGFSTTPGRKSTRLANLVYGLATAYDLTGALGVPEKYGSVEVGAFVKFSDALREDMLNDELYGGLTVGYRW